MTGATTLTVLTVGMLWAAGAYLRLQQLLKHVRGLYGPVTAEARGTLVKCALLWFLPMSWVLPKDASWSRERERLEMGAREFLDDAGEQMRSLDGEHS